MELQNQATSNSSESLIVQVIVARFLTGVVALEGAVGQHDASPVAAASEIRETAGTTTGDDGPSGGAVSAWFTILVRNCRAHTIPFSCVGVTWLTLASQEIAVDPRIRPYYRRDSRRCVQPPRLRLAPLRGAG